MTVAELQARLTKVQAAISSILDGTVMQKTTTGPGGEHSVTYLNLDQLRKMETELLWQIQRAQSGGFSLARFGEGT